MSTIDELCHHRWTLPVLAEMQRTRGSRFATLLGTLGISGESLRRILAALQAAGLVTRNVGYGHPLRPEYVLTSAGRAVAPECATLLSTLAGRESVGLKKWSLPILAQLDQPRRFAELHADLDPITSRALTLALRELQAAGLVDRHVTDDSPPAVRYAATKAARPIVAAARALT